MSDVPRTPAQTPELRTPAHGKGKLRRGGSNGGAGGRPPDEIRNALRGALWKHRAKLEKFAQSEDPSVAMKALDLLAKYGLGTTITPTDTKGGTYTGVDVRKTVVDPKTAAGTGDT